MCLCVCVRVCVCVCFVQYRCTLTALAHLKNKVPCEFQEFRHIRAMGASQRRGCKLINIYYYYDDDDDDDDDDDEDDEDDDDDDDMHKFTRGNSAQGLHDALPAQPTG